MMTVVSQGEHPVYIINLQQVITVITLSKIKRYWFVVLGNIFSLKVVIAINIKGFIF